jgi:putative oxidoreductase
MDVRRLQSYAAQLRAALRIMTALLFIEHGIAKLVQFPVPHRGVPGPLPAILYCLVFLYLAPAGPATFSIDAARDKKR